MADDNNTNRRIEELEKELAELKKKQKNKKSESENTENANDTPFDVAANSVKDWFIKKQIERQFEQAKLKNDLDGAETADPVENFKNWQTSWNDRFTQPKKKTRFDPFGQAEQERKKNIDNAVNGILKAFVLVAIAAFVFMFLTDWQEKKQAKIDNANNMPAVSVDVIFRNFTNSPESAKNQYLNERLKVSGEVTFQISVNDSGCITLDGGDYGIAYAYFDDTSKLSHLSSGDTIVFTGDFDAYSTIDLGAGKMLYLYFYDCELVS